METNELERTLGRLKVETAPISECPDIHILAAQALGRTIESTPSEVTNHISHCNWCLTRLADFSHIRGSDERPAPELVLRRAQRLGRIRSTRAPRWAAAAVLALAAGLAFMQFRPISVPEASSPPPALSVTPGREVRNIDTQAMAPELLSPQRDGVLSAKGARFEWSAVAGSLYYDVRVVNADGEKLWQARVEDTRWQLPDQARLEAGQEYFVRVDAYLAEAKRVSSRHVRFIASDTP